MNTEDDTFRRLKRAPFKDAARAVLKWSFSSVGDKPTIEEILEPFGWTLEEFSAHNHDELNIYLEGLRRDRG